MNTVSTLQEEAILKGELFVASFYEQLPTASPILYIGLQTGNLPLWIESSNIIFNRKITIEYFENENFSGGTEIVLPNMNRAISKSLQAKFYLSPTTSPTPGNGFFRWHAESTAVSVSAGERPDFVYEPLTQYVFVITNTDATNAADITLSWRCKEQKL